MGGDIVVYDLADWIVDWINKRARRWGLVARTVDGQTFFWGQVACYMVLGPDWNEHDLSVIPQDAIPKLREWDDDNPPEWFVVPAGEG